VNPEDKLRLKKQYADLDDSQIIEMLGEGKEAYVPGAFELLQEEARNRGLEINRPPEQEKEIIKPQSLPEFEPEIDVNTYAQLVIVTRESDRAFIESLFERTDISYFFQNLNIRPENALPAGFMVDSLRVEDAIELLKDFKPSSSILLW
jgi:hypothetical protein